MRAAPRNTPLRRRSRFALGLVLGLAGAFGGTMKGPAVAEAAIVERIVAVVGEKAILLTDLRERALPILLRVYASVPEGPQRSATISQVYRTVLERMVDEELEDIAAQNAGITVSTDEVDKALARVARQNDLTQNQILVEAKRSGLTVSAYREELRRQLLQAKMSQLRLRGRVSVDQSDTEDAYRRLAIQERMQQVQRTLALRIPMGQTEEDRIAQKKLAEAVSERARRGEDFQALINEYASAAGSGLRPPRAPVQEPKAIQRATVALDVGETSIPIKQGADWVILQVIERPPSELPPLKDVQEEMHQQVYMEKMAEARETWLAGLRRRTHVEIRL